jgi:hypothetical protein
MESAFLAVSCVATVWQSWMYNELLTRRAAVNRGLIRTSLCRVGAGVLYVLVGINALFFREFVLQIAFGAFAFTQLMWCLNGLADVTAQRKKRTGGP